MTDVKAMATCIEALKVALTIALGSDVPAARAKLLGVFDGIARASGHSPGYLEEDEFIQALESLKTKLSGRQMSAIFHYYRRPGRVAIDYRRFLVDIKYDRKDSELVDALQNALQGLMETDPGLSTKLTRFFSDHDFAAPARLRAEALGQDRISTDPAALRAHDKAEYAKFVNSVGALGAGFTAADTRRLASALRQQGPAGADEQTVLRLVTALDTYESKKKSGGYSDYASAIVDKFAPNRDEQYKSAGGADSATPKGFRPTAEVVAMLRDALKEIRTAGLVHISPWVLLHSLLTSTYAAAHADTPAVSAAATVAAAAAAVSTADGASTPTATKPPRLGIELGALAGLLSRFDPLDIDAEAEHMVADQPQGSFTRLAAAATLTQGEMQRAFASLNAHTADSSSGTSRSLSSAPLAGTVSSTVLTEAAALELFGLSEFEDDCLSLGAVKYTLRERLSRERRAKLGYLNADGSAKAEWTEEAIAKDVAAKTDYVLRFSLKTDDSGGASSGWTFESKPCLVALSGPDLLVSLAAGDVPKVPLHGLGVSFQRDKWSVQVDVFERPKAAPPADTLTVPVSPASTAATATSGTPEAASTATTAAPGTDAHAAGSQTKTDPSATTQKATKDAKVAKDGSKELAKDPASKAPDGGDRPQEAKAEAKAVLVGQLLLSLRDMLDKMLGGAAFVGGWMDVYLWSKIVDYSAQVSFAAPVKVAAPGAAGPAAATAPAAAPTGTTPATTAASGTPTKGPSPAPTGTPSALALAVASGTPTSTPAATAAAAITPAAANSAAPGSPKTDPKADAKADRLQCTATLQSNFSGRGSEGSLDAGVVPALRQEMSLSLQECLAKGHLQRSPPSALRLQLRHSVVAPACTRTLQHLCVELVTAMLVAPKDKAAAAEEPAKVVKPRTLARQAAKQAGDLGGKAVLSEAEAAVVVSAAWRSKRVRKGLRVQAVAARLIQRIFRGSQQRTKFLATKGRQLELQRDEATRTARLRRIRAKERELTMLRRIPPEEYLHYERLRRDHSACMVQRSWRRLRPQFSASCRTVQRPPAPVGDSLVRARNDAKRAALSGHQARVQAALSAAATAGWRHRVGDDALRARIEVDALGLAQLQRRIKVTPLFLKPLPAPL